MKIGPMTAVDVHNSRTFADYALQELGTPYPYDRHIAILTKKVKDFFAKNPRATWMTLCKTVDWAKQEKRHPTFPHSVLGLVPFAFGAGCLPELKAPELDPDVEEAIQDALAVEEDPVWRSRFFSAQGRKGRRFILDQWTILRK